LAKKLGQASIGDFSNSFLARALDMKKGAAVLSLEQDCLNASKGWA
jgi:hypothetical protein